MSKPPPIPPKFANVDHLAWIIVGDIFTANGILITEDEHDPLHDALAAELARRVAAMQSGGKPPTPAEQVEAARRLRGYGCFMYPYDQSPAALEVFVDTAHEWHQAHIFAGLARRPFPGDKAAKAVAQLAIRKLQAAGASGNPAPAPSPKRRQRKQP